MLKRLFSNLLTDSEAEALVPQPAPKRPRLSGEDSSSAEEIEEKMEEVPVPFAAPEAPALPLPDIAPLPVPPLPAPVLFLAEATADDPFPMPFAANQTAMETLSRIRRGTKAEYEVNDLVVFKLTNASMSGASAEHVGWVERKTASEMTVVPLVMQRLPGQRMLWRLAFPQTTSTINSSRVFRWRPTVRLFSQGGLQHVVRRYEIGETLPAVYDSAFQ